MLFDGIKRRNSLEGLADTGGLRLEGFEDLAPGMTPALSMSHAGLLGIGAVGIVTIPDEHGIGGRRAPP
jgi:hypothetical protein